MLLNVINPKIHGIRDFVTAGFLIAGPYLFGFNKKDKLATKLSIVNGISILGLSLLTKYPVSAFKLVPFRTHGFIEIGEASLLALAPFLFNYRTGKARNFHLLAGISILVVAALTNYKGVVVKTDKVTTDKNRVAA